MLERYPFVNSLGRPFKVLVITSLELDPLLFKASPSEGNGETPPQTRPKGLVDSVLQLAADCIAIGERDFPSRLIYLKLHVGRLDNERLGHDGCEQLAWLQVPFHYRSHQRHLLLVVHGRLA